MGEFKEYSIATSQNELENPFICFKRWLDEAKKRDIKNYNAGSFATVNKKGHPDSRQMVMKDVDEKKGTIVFYTNGNSAMGDELDNNPYIAVNVYWPELDRSIRINGQVEYVSEKESDEYWISRNLDAQVSASVSQQGSLMTSKEEFAKKLEAAKEKAVKEGGVQRPPHWRGYRIFAHRIELWAEGSEESRTHNRMQWDRDISRKGSSISEVSGFNLSDWNFKLLQP